MICWFIPNFCVHKKIWGGTKNWGALLPIALRGYWSEMMVMFSSKVDYKTVSVCLNIAAGK